MERLLQYWDDLDDLVYAVALTWESIRRLARFTFHLSGLVTVKAIGIYFALTAPPLAIATATLLFVTLLYRGVVYHSPRGPVRQAAA
jgi:hypothetical protein